VLEVEGKVSVMTVNPDILSDLFNNDELKSICNQMSDMYRNILEEATL